MKEATGELNMTVVTVVAITAVITFFYVAIWPNVKLGLMRNTCSNLCPAAESGESKATVTKEGDNYTCTCPDGSTITVDRKGNTTDTPSDQEHE